MDTFYEVLDVKNTATSAEIKSAYRRVARTCHPDVTKLPIEVATTRFKEAAAAWEVLSDSAKRKRYDATLKRQASSPEWVHATGPAYRQPTFGNDYMSGWVAEARLNVQWEQFISRPFEASRATRRFFARTWVLNVLALPLYYALFTGGANAVVTKAFSIAFASKDEPMSSTHPMQGFMIGAVLSVVITFLMWLHAWRRPSAMGMLGSGQRFREALNSEAFETWSMLYIVLCFGGLLVGHYFF